ncbi:hypothetical protein NE237_008315 [Protea cynaroides]|uniref:Uncharacterized protein n=1 Tax=Protea cynaroides TaxID=273540 RepID=A0A9Q0JSA9_9MAGN|nr:hypothetical protein NE237_008315 [Protea cynaroides]
MKKKEEEKNVECARPLVLDEVAGNNVECQPKGVDGVHLKDPDIQASLEEDWTPIRVKKKRSAGSPGGLNPTLCPSHRPLSLPLQQCLEQVSTRGKSPPLASNFIFPPKKSSFQSNSRCLNSGACSESAASGLNHFGCLAAEEDQSVHAGPPKPPVPPVPAKPAHEPITPSLEPSAALSFSGLKSSPSSAGHTPYPPRRPAQVSAHGSSRASPLAPWTLLLPFLALQKPNLDPALLP